MEHSRLSPTLSTVLFASPCRPHCSCLLGRRLRSTLRSLLVPNVAPVLLAFFLLTTPQLAASQSSPPPPRGQNGLGTHLPETIVQLSSGASRTCATGIRISQGTILTSLHVASSLCRETRCPDMTISRAPGIGSAASMRAPAPAAQVLMAFPARDAALLTFTDPWDPPPPLGVATPQEKGQVMIAGFPRCGPLQIARGAIEDIGTLVFENSALTNFGGSGSPIFDPDLNVIGLVSQATPDWSSFLNIFLGSSFKNTAVRLDDIAPQLYNREGPLVFSEPQILLKHYEERSRLPQGLRRIAGSLDFMGRVEEMKRWTLRDGGKAAGRDQVGWNYLGQLPDVGPRAEAEVSNPDLLELIYLYNFTEHGARTSAMRLLSAADITLLSEQFGPVWKSAFARFSGSPSPGILLLVAQEGVYFFSVALLVLIAWSVSVTIVALLTHGGWGRRSLVAFLVAFAGWPLSFVAWLLLRRLKRGKSRQKSD